MPELVFFSGTMDCGKSTLALQMDHNHRQRGRAGLIFTRHDRAGVATVSSRLGLRRAANEVTDDLDFWDAVAAARTRGSRVDYLICDEAQFYTPAQVEQLARVVDEMAADVFAFGITADFRTRLFPGSQRLLELADRVQVLQVEALCWCGARATHNARTLDGIMVVEGEQVVVGNVGAEASAVGYEVLCRRHHLRRMTATAARAAAVDPVLGQDGRMPPAPARARHLVTASTLADELAGERPPRVLDVRWKLKGPPGVIAYQQGHIPGAVFADLDRDLAGTPGTTGRHPLPDPRVIAGAMRRSGVDADTEVVVYDDTDATAAARAWWTLRYFGHHRVRVLDGGLRAWREAGLPISTEEVDVEPGTFTPRPGCMPVLDAGAAATVACDGVLIDARAPERYRGDQELIDPVAGHIPGAVNVPGAAALDSNGCFRTAEELREHFDEVNASGRARVGAYCGSGVSAAHTVLALAVAEIPAALYVGSWSGWIADRTRPVARGPEPGAATVLGR